MRKLAEGSQVMAESRFRTDVADADRESAVVDDAGHILNMDAVIASGDLANLNVRSGC